MKILLPAKSSVRTDIGIEVDILSYPRNVDTALSEVLVFKLFWAEIATDTVVTTPIVIALDIRCPHYFPTDKAFTVDAFYFQRVEEAFHTSVIVTAALCTHATAQTMPIQ